MTCDYPNADGVCGSRAGVLRVLRVYRDTGNLDGWWIDDPALHDIDADTLSDAGPSVDQIDWTGIDEID